MSRKPVLKMAVSSILMGSMLVSCAAFNSGARPDKLAAKAEASLAKGNTSDAVMSAEAAVMADPRNVDYRKTLGQAYLADGRFASAERSFMDAIELGDSSSRTIVSLTLSQLASGNKSGALDTLSTYRSQIPAGDYGLAMALAGETKAGVDVLSNSLRGGENNPKIRQNLALAYALDGRWREAKLLVSQDVAPDAVDGRIRDWALMARPEAYEQRVASIIGVTPKIDAGQPMQLALANFPEAPVLAEVAPEPVPLVAEEAPVQFAMAESPAVESGVKITLPPVQRVSVPASEPVAAPKFVTETPKPVAAAPAVAPRAGGAVAPGSYIVQLGAFSSPDNAKAAWTKLSGQHKSLKGFDYASSTVDVKGKKLYRLAAMGFGNKASADALCAGIKAKGGSCMTRQAGGNTAPAATRLAARR